VFILFMGDNGHRRAEKTSASRPSRVVAGEFEVEHERANPQQTPKLGPVVTGLGLIMQGIPNRVNQTGQVAGTEGGFEVACSVAEAGAEALPAASVATAVTVPELADDGRASDQVPWAEAVVVAVPRVPLDCG
jgi:hypothetical protein